MKPRLWLLLILLAAAAALGFSQLPLAQTPGSAADLFGQLAEFNASPTDLLNTLEREISTPPPLRGLLDQPSAALAREDIRSETNRHRADNTLPALKENAALNRAAENKLADMFAQQYFEHVNPDDIGPGEVAEAAGYAFLRVGENLALGNFASAAALVQAWMDSPGHRANILEKNFTEIGIAAGQGTFEGQSVWLAVQTFGLPASACTAPDSSLRAALDSAKKTAAELAPGLDALKSEFTRLAAEGEAKIQEGNEKIQEGNRIAEETGDNDQAQSYWDEGGRLQAEGQALVEQAEEKRRAYNDRVDELDQLSDESETLVTKLNEQIRAYNACLSRFGD